MQPTSNPTTELARVVCVIECKAADELLKQHCANENKSWNIAFEDLMNAVTLVMEGKHRSAYVAIEEAIGMPLFHPLHYNNDTFSQPATDLVDGMAIALKHAIPRVHPNKENIIVRCNYLQVTDKWFVFDVLLQEPVLDKGKVTVYHF